MHALISSAGKDSTLALDRARRGGVDVRALVNIYDGPSGRVAFHGVRRELVAAHARACGLEPILAATGPDAPYEQVFTATMVDLRDRGFTGVIFGNIHLADVREWYETRIRDAGLEHLEPLWGDPPADLLLETIERGFKAIVVSVDLQQGAGDLLGAELTADVARQIARLDGVDPCGERGEFHSYVFDGPTFTHPVPVVRGVVREERNHRLLDLLLDGAPEPAA